MKQFITGLSYNAPGTTPKHFGSWAGHFCHHINTEQIPAFPLHRPNPSHHSQPQTGGSIGWQPTCHPAWQKASGSNQPRPLSMKRDVHAKSLLQESRWYGRLKQNAVEKPNKWSLVICPLTSGILKDILKLLHPKITRQCLIHPSD